MSHFNVHGKVLPIPSFFQVYNFGGGSGDKVREIVYAELTGDTPALINYFYINNRFPHLFQSSLFDRVNEFSTVGDLYNYIRASLIEKGEIFRDYTSEEFDFNRKVFLLDSGAFNIIKKVASDVGYDVEEFYRAIMAEVAEYYEFAAALKFDIVVGFDMGGKYTEKDGESEDEDLQAFLANIDAEELNRRMLIATAEYMTEHRDYFPHILATVHGETPEKYKECVEEILQVEEQYGINFWGFALGGIASYKQVDKTWYNDIDLRRIGKRGFVETITPARACKIVRELVGDRPIHALGCGGYNNITLNYYCGATSFDAASPVRRVGDGNLESTRIVFNPTPSKIGFSKYFMGGINADGSLRTEVCGYIKLNEVPNEMPLCGCAACRVAGSVETIKTLYSMKETDTEANYFSRQLIGLHAVAQHRKLCETVARYETVNEFVNAYPSRLNIGLQYIFSKI